MKCFILHRSETTTYIIAIRANTLKEAISKAKDTDPNMCNDQHTETQWRCHGKYDIKD